ncbi:MAG: hypothetical protein BWY28_03271 [bacterium ADurb.Bin236]|nr:MAG: hypothetical protein BWY28_03271 [bacterium ADurb.Bin236]
MSPKLIWSPGEVTFSNINASTLYVKLNVSIVIVSLPSMSDAVNVASYSPGAKPSREAVSVFVCASYSLSTGLPSTIASMDSISSGASVSSTSASIVPFKAGAAGNSLGRALLCSYESAIASATSGNFHGIPPSCFLAFRRASIVSMFTLEEEAMAENGEDGEARLCIIANASTGSCCSSERTVSSSEYWTGATATPLAPSTQPGSFLIVIFGPLPATTNEPAHSIELPARSNAVIVTIRLPEGIAPGDASYAPEVATYCEISSSPSRNSRTDAESRPTPPGLSSTLTAMRSGDISNNAPSSGATLMTDGDVVSAVISTSCVIVSSARVADAMIVFAPSSRFKTALNAPSSPTAADIPFTLTVAPIVASPFTVSASEFVICPFTGATIFNVNCAGSSGSGTTSV